MQAAASALRSGYRVVWIDTATALPGRRLEEVLSWSLKLGTDDHEEETSGHTTHDLLSRFSHYDAPTLAHLLALVSHAPSTFPPAEAALLVIDSLSTSIDNAYPRNAENQARSNKNEQAKWLADRRQAVISEVGSKLANMAATRNIAILVTSNIVTKIKVGAEALLRAAISGQEWDNAIGSRIALFRDWVKHGAESGHLRSDGSSSAARFAELVKSNADARHGVTRKVVAFQIYEGGIRELTEVSDPPQISPVKSNALTRKRQHDEIADSEVEDSSSDYGWHEADDQLAAEGLVDASFV